jgi:hypothetical protein
MPCRRHTSAFAALSSLICFAAQSFNLPIICSSLNLLRFIRPFSQKSDSTEKWRDFRGARHEPEILRDPSTPSRLTRADIGQFPSPFLDVFLQKIK